MRTTSIGVIGTVFACVLPAAAAVACERPGTPNQVSAVPLSTTQIQVRWRNTARNDETVWWDVEMREQGGKLDASWAGIGRGDRGYGLPVTNVYTVPEGATRCFRIRARTAPKTGGCVSALWSHPVCMAALRPNRPVRGLGKQRTAISVAWQSWDVFHVRGSGYQVQRPITIRLAGAAARRGSIGLARGRRIVTDARGSFNVTLTNVCLRAGTVSFVASDGTRSNKNPVSATCRGPAKVTPRPAPGTPYRR